ncbi:MAG: 2-oxoacid:acceptor oxidoreductase family protein [Planctomycetota bacterium]|jgi:2-oxoglutarate ferredoxin oxidoreductase subunit gamma
MSITEIKVGGLGGQGVILAGMIIGRGASIYDGKHSTLTQSFGPEARGSACREYPYLTHPDMLVVMSQEACNRFAPEMSPQGTLLYEADLVRPGEVSPGVDQYGVPCTRIAEDLQRRMVANIVMVGFFAAVTDLVTVDALRKSVEQSVPAGTETLNLTAFERGHTYGLELKEGKSPSLAACEK